MADPLLLEQPASVASMSTALRCLLIVGRLSGLNLRPETLLPEGVSSANLSTVQLLDCARRAGFKCRAASFQRADAAQLVKSLPAIVHFKDGSSMVMLRVIEQNGLPRVVLEDPNADADNLVLLDRIRFEQAWTGHAILLARRYSLSDQNRPFSFGLIAALIFQERALFVQVLVAGLTLSLVALMPAIVAKIMYVRIIPYRALGSWTVLTMLFLLLLLAETAISALRRFFSARLSARVEIKLAIHVFNKVLNLPIDYFERNSLGMTLHRFGLLQRLRVFMAQHVFGTLLDLTVVFFFLPLMLFISPLLTGIVLAVAALLILWVCYMMPRYRLVSARLEAATSQRYSFMSQNISGIRTIKSLALDARQRHEWAGMTKDIAGLRLKESSVANRVQTGSSLLERLMLNLSLAVGIYIALRQDSVLSMGTMFAFYIQVQRLISPIQNIAQLIRGFDQTRLSLSEISSLVDHPAEEGRSGQGLRVPIKGHVEFTDVRFKYRGALNPALRSVSFEVPPGTTLGVMGRSGSGKTTLTRLLQRLHTDYQGRVKIDGVDVRDFDVDYLRKSLGVVLQENFLFSGSIRENIMAAKPNASFEEMVYAARLAGAEEFIDKLPRGYETAIYEGSPNLSGGQRQRLAIARALIANPRILILDEATSALDAESESIVNANLRRISHGRTVIVISHRLSSLVKADAILVLDSGEVRDIGRHEDLLERSDIYSEMWHHQNSAAEHGASQRGASAA